MKKQKQLRNDYLNGLYCHWTPKYPELPPMLYINLGSDYGNAGLSFYLGEDSGAILRDLADKADELWAEKQAFDKLRAEPEPVVAE